MNGIFALRNKPALRGLGTNENVPYWCWNQSGFSDCMNTQLVNAQTYCAANGLADDATCISNQQGVMQQSCIDSCLATQPSDPAAVTPATPDTTTTTGGGSTVCPNGTWNAPDNMSCVKSSGKCTDAAVIAYVQGQIGVATDGKWGPLSTAALTKSGKKFTDIATGCVGAAPSGGAGTGTGVSKITPKAGGVKPSATATQAGGFLGIPLIAWAGVAAIAAVLLVVKKKKPATPNRRRRHHRRY